MLLNALNKILKVGINLNKLIHLPLKYIFFSFQCIFKNHFTINIFILTLTLIIYFYFRIPLPFSPLSISTKEFISVFSFFSHHHTYISKLHHEGLCQYCADKIIPRRNRQEETYQHLAKSSSQSAPTTDAVSRPTFCHEDTHTDWQTENLTTLSSECSPLNSSPRLSAALCWPQAAGEGTEQQDSRQGGIKHETQHSKKTVNLQN